MEGGRHVVSETGKHLSRSSTFSSAITSHKQSWLCVCIALAVQICLTLALSQVWHCMYVEEGIGTRDERIGVNQSSDDSHKELSSSGGFTRGGHGNGRVANGRNLRKKEEKEEEPPMSFVTMYYPRANKHGVDWRLRTSRIVAEANDRILRRHGGLTVFTVPEARNIVENWNVSGVVYVDGISKMCENNTITRRIHEMCPKKYIFTDDKMMALKHILYLDLDARILSEEFVEKIQYYRYFADFAGVPDHMGWDNFNYFSLNADFNAGMFYMRTSAFNNEDFKKSMTEGCIKSHDQHCITLWMKKNREKLWIELLPSRMHCRGQYLAPDCLLVHNWGHSALNGTVGLLEILKKRQSG